MRWKLTGLIAAIAATLPVLSATAQQPVCGDHEVMVERLNGTFAEKRVGAGLGHDGQLVEVFASPEGTTWSLLVTLPTGKACLVGAGEAWQMPDDADGKQARLVPQR